MKANQVFLIGYVGTHLAAKKLENGKKKISIRMATHFPTKNEEGDKIDHTVWHDVIAWGDKADYAERTFVKGSKILVDGSIAYRTYPDYSGHIRYVTEIIVHSLTNLDR